MASDSRAITSSLPRPPPNASSRSTSTYGASQEAARPGTWMTRGEAVHHRVIGLADEEGPAHHDGVVAAHAQPGARSAHRQLETGHRGRRPAARGAQEVRVPARQDHQIPRGQRHHLAAVEHQLALAPGDDVHPAQPRLVEPHLEGRAGLIDPDKRFAIALRDRTVCAYSAGAVAVRDDGPRSAWP